MSDIDFSFCRNLKNGGFLYAKEYLQKNGWKMTDTGHWVDITGRCAFICHPKVAWRVQRMRDHQKMKKCTIFRWWKKLLKKC